MRRNVLSVVPSLEDEAEDRSTLSCASPQRAASVHRFPANEPVRRTLSVETRPYAEVVCELCEQTVALTLEVPLKQMRARTRMTQDVALARQIAMYLASTMFDLQAVDIAPYFKRDRTTVGHACRTVEDKRESLSFDTTLCQLETILELAVEAIEAGRSLGDSGHAGATT